ASLGESRAQAGLVAEGAIGLEHPSEWKVERSRDVPARHARADFGFHPREAPGAARVDELLGGAGDVGEYLVLGAHRARAVPRADRAGRSGMRSRFERPAFGAPLAEPAVENRDLLDPVHPEDEPGARRGLHPAVVVDHHPVAIVDADLA